MQNVRDRLKNFVGSLDLTAVLSVFRHCLPLCESWNRKLDVSYSSLQTHSSSAWGVPEEKVGRTRKSVYYSDLTYEEFREQEMTDIYTLFSAVGGLAGLYTGSSIITFVQLMAFGIWCTGKTLRMRHKAGRVGPGSSCQADDMTISSWPSLEVS